MRAKVEATVCDLGDEKLAVGTITWKRDGKSRTNDLCVDHLEILSANGHLPKRGGPRGPYKRRKRTTAKRATAKKAATRTRRKATTSKES